MGTYSLTRKSATTAAIEIHPVIGSLDEPKTYRKTADNCAVLIHCASDSGNPDGIEKQTLRELTESACCGHQHKTVIFTSGVWVYGNTGNKPQDETDRLNPLNLSSWRPGLGVCWSKTTICGIVIRPGVVYGKQGGMTGIWFQQAETGKLQIIGDGKNHWSMVHVDDVASAYVRAAESGVRGEIFNISDPSRETVSDMVKAVATACNYAKPIAQISYEDALEQMGAIAEGIAVDQHVDARKATRLLNWQPRHSGFIDDVDIYYQTWKAYQKQ
ncbi:MAG: NAD-dependent epimerase/dehydratase family protein [Calditrichia bacterium]